jgi:hypothetical protein
MSSGSDLEPFAESVDEVFRRMGISNPVVMSSIVSEWDELAGPPWSGRSRPLYIQGSTLVVEADSPGMVAFLRYGASSLVSVIEERFGPDVVGNVDVRPPATR